MTWLVRPLPPQEPRTPADPDAAGFGTLATNRGNLPLDELTVDASITGLVAGVEVTQGFRNPCDEPLEATYIFPLPDRGAVTGMRMQAGGHVVLAELKERGKARADYDASITSGRRASLAEQERPAVFTMRVGNILSGERVVIHLSLVQPLPYADGEAEFRFPLVVAPRYVPGTPLPGSAVGTGWVGDTDAVPDASRISPPVLLPGLADPVQLSINVSLNPGGFDLQGVRSSLHAVVDRPAPTNAPTSTANDAATSTTDDGRSQWRRIRIEPGERADRDFLLRLHYAPERAATSAATLGDGTWQLTVLPPVPAAIPRPRDVVLLLDRSGSMSGWKMVAARRAAARIVDTLTGADRFTVLGFDHLVESPPLLPAGLVWGSDRNRYRAVEHLARLEARGGTELVEPLLQAIELLTQERTGKRNDGQDSERSGAGLGSGPAIRDRVLVLVTDGQVGNEDQILHEVADGLAGVRVHVVGIDETVNAGFLARLAVIGGGRCELVESEGRLDEAAEQIHRRIAAPVLTGLQVHGEGLDDATVSPRRLPALVPGVPLVITGRITERSAAASGSAGVEVTGTGPTSLTVTGTHPDGSPWSTTVPLARATGVPATTATTLWARSHLRDLEDDYAAQPVPSPELEQRIIQTSLRFGVLCRFTAFVAVDERMVTDGRVPHRVTQPVEPARGWDMLAAPEESLPPAPPAPVGHVMLTSMPAAMTTWAPSPLAGVGRARASFAGRMVSLASQLRQRTAQSPDTGPGSPGGESGGDPAVEAEAVTDVRRQLAVELRRLKSASTLPGIERAILLADLSTRLTALVTDLSQVGASDSTLSPLRSLATELAVSESVIGDPQRLQELWQRTISVLTSCTGETPTPTPS